ncbi:MAG: LuxR C-terminal-related transcriptional regulator [Firmicutes bacterium]|nr:LuxR C-terminal-related transcriptional regulator [Bacillota bacterium]
MPNNPINNRKNVLHVAKQPPLAEHFFRRPVIEQLLKNAFKKPLTAIIAGAGFGKTQAVLAVLGDMECNAAWMQLSQLDNHVARFWERMATAYRPWSENLYESLLTMGYPNSIALFDHFLKLLTKELTQDNPFILVLDDFYLINNKEILNFIEIFIAAQTPNFSVVLISRKMPDISLSAMLSKGLLSRIGEDELRFSLDETSAYLCSLNIQLEKSMVSDIYAYTEGWIFAIYLVGLAIQKGNINNPIFSTKIDTFNLIEKEVFLAASPELQDILIKIAIPDTITLQLLHKLTNHNLTLMSEMQQTGMFIHYDPLADNYRIHPLFREFLLEKKHQLAKRDIFKLHLVLAGWFSKNGYLFEAIYHYKKIGYYKEIFDLIIAIPGRLSYESAEAIIELIEQAPAKTLKALPIILVVKAGYLFNNNRLKEAQAGLLQLQSEYEEQPATTETKAVLGEIYLLLAVICMVTSDYAFEVLFIRADEYLPNGSRLIDYRTGMAEGVNACSITNPAAGELKRYQDSLFRIAPYAARAMNGCCYGLEFLNAAESSLYVGDWKAAEKYAYEAIHRSRKYQQYDMEYMANFVLLRIFTAKGNYKKTTGILNKMKKQLETLHHAECISLYAMISGWFFTKLGKTELIAKWLRNEEETQKVFAPVVIGRAYLVFCDYLLAEERYYELLAFLHQTDKLYENRGILFAKIQNLITKAIVYHNLNKQKESIYYLTKAYELSYPNNLIIQYIEYGNRMRTLIHSVRQSNNCDIPQDFLNRIYTKSSSYAKMLSQLVSAYDADHMIDNKNKTTLSKRELEVLEYLYRGMTRKEMAASCYVSLSTINSIMRNIYNKLGAINSADAVRIAKEKSLI